MDNHDKSTDRGRAKEEGELSLPEKMGAGLYDVMKLPKKKKTENQMKRPSKFSHAAAVSENGKNYCLPIDKHTLGHWEN